MLRRWHHRDGGMQIKQRGGWRTVFRFLQRVQAFRPIFATMLIDTSVPFPHERLVVFNAVLRTLGYAPLVGKRGFYRGAMDVYVVTVERSIEISLSDILKYA